MEKNQQQKVEQKIQIDKKKATFFRCKKCRAQLFKQVAHTGPECTSIFIQKPKWLQTDNMQNQVKLNCPKCKVNLGDVVFSGKMCSCSEWITPAYQIHKNKVDQIKPLGL